MQKSVCAFCGVERAITRDHVPPKNLFPKPRPNNLITVPACGSCNWGTSKDDEWFRVKLNLRHEVGSNPAARQTWAKIFKSLHREQAATFRNSFVSDMLKCGAFSPGGIYVEDRLAYSVDRNRLHRIVTKMVKGLYFQELGTVFSQQWDTGVFLAEDIHSNPSRADIEKTIIAPLLKSDPIVVAEGIFSYRVARGLISTS